MGRAAPPRVDAALALIERRGRYLICRRRASDVLGGYWEFPGGKREPGESWIACLRRELREELGIAVTAVRSFAALRHRYPHAALRFRVYRCALASGRPQPLRSQATRWVTAGELARYRFPPANRGLLELLSRPHAIIRRPIRWTRSPHSRPSSSASRKPRPRSRR